MKRFLHYIIILIFIFSASETQAQFWKRKINQLDQNRKKTGLWIEHWDKDGKTKMTKYHFKNGRETKACKNYHPNGKRSTKFKYVKDRIKVKHYDEKGRITEKGWSRLEYNEKDIHYYYHGLWKYYYNGHKLAKTSYYEHGVLITTHKEKKKQQTNSIDK